LVLHHPASEYAIKEQVRQQLALQQAALPPEHFTTAVQQGAASELTTTLTRLIAGLLAAPRSADAASKEMRTAPKLVEQLTEREGEILRLIAQGLSNQAIADTLIRSTGTVQWYSSEIYGKLGVASRTQAVAEARRLKLIE
jgi:ATP/maltotriose-dependent transcriptional regulator MalT